MMTFFNYNFILNLCKLSKINFLKSKYYRSNYNMLQPVRKLSLFSGCNKSKSLLSNNIRQNTYFRPIEIDYHMNISISHRNYQNCSSQLFGCKPIEFG